MQRYFLPIFVGLLTALFVGGFPLQAGAQAESDTQAEAEAFGDAIDVNVVNVEVYVTDKQGQPVTDLTADDFEVFENKRPMQLTNFYTVEDGQRSWGGLPSGELAPGESAPGESAPSPEGLAPLEAVPVAENDRLRLVIFVDNFNIRPLERKRVMGQITSFLLRNVGKDDQVMLMTYDRSLKVRQPFTSNPAIVADALERLAEVRGDGGQYDSTRNRILRELDEVRSPAEATSMIRPFAESMLHDVKQTVIGLKELVDFLAGLPGRKMVLHVSSGIPMVAASDLFAAVSDIFDLQSVSTMSEFHLYDSSRLFEELGAQANANGVTFYTLDAGGLRIGASRSAEFEGLNSARAALNIDSEYEANIQNTLYFMAESTGGEAIMNQNNVLPALKKVASHFRNYYSLGYMPGHSGDGRFYNIKVKVKRKGVVVRHREGYRDKDASARMNEGTRASLIHSFEQNPLGVTMAFGEAHERDKDTFLVSIQVRIPVGKLVLLPLPEGSHLARVRLYIAAMDDKGGFSDVQETPLSIKIPGDAVEAARGEFWVYNHKLLMRRGRQKVALGLRDQLGAESSFLSRSHRVGG